MSANQAFTVTPKLTASFTRPASATQYTAGDHIGNSGTGSSVTPMTFSLPRPDGRIYGARCVIAPASSNLVITACAFDLLLFRPESGIPFAAAGYPADNAALTLTAAMLRELVGVIPFIATAWRNPLGAFTASTAGWQDAKPANRPFISFNASNVGSNLIGLIQATDVWNPGNIANQFDIALDTDLD